MSGQPSGLELVAERRVEDLEEMTGWKEEPVSPEVAWLELDDWPEYDYGDATLLEDIEFIIKDEPQFGSWTENTSVFEGGFPGCESPPGQSGASEERGWPGPGAKTSALLQEFEDVLTRALTPPDSPEVEGRGTPCPLPSAVPVQPPYYHPTLIHLQPPPPAPHLLQPLQPPAPAPQSHHQLSPLLHQDNSNESSVHDLDALVAGSFQQGDCSSSDSGYEDPDFKPGSPGRSGSRARPYPSLEERKARKKEQNKNAATRYRQKKKQEIEVILSEEKELQNKNETLKAELEEVQREMKYLKSLLRHMFKAKGLIR